MGRAPCCDKAKVSKGLWSHEEDAKLKEYIEKYGTGGNWIALPQKVGLRRCGKSCRLRWLNYLRPNIKHGDFSEDEDRIICSLYASIGSRWSIIAAQLHNRTDNDIKNYWNTKLKKKLFAMVSSSSQHRKPPPLPFKDSFSINTFGLVEGPISYPSSNDLSNINTTNLDNFQVQKQSFVDDLLQYYSMDNNINLEISSYGKEIMIKQEEMGFNQSYTISNDFQQGTHNFILSKYGINNNGGNNVNDQWSDPYQEKQNGYAFFNPNNLLGYNLEEVKQQQ